MTDFEQMLEGAGPSLAELLAHYEAGDDIGAAIDKAHGVQYGLMRSFPTGVPSGVMFAGVTKALEWTTDLLAAMVVEIAAAVHGWDEGEESEQQELTQAVLQLLTTHASIVVLSAFAPTDEEVSG